VPTTKHLDLGVFGLESLGTHHRGKGGNGSRDHALAELPGAGVENHGDNRRSDENVNWIFIMRTRSHPFQPFG
jgi:hypothetical protein